MSRELALKCSFDEFVGEKVVSPSYSSAILGPPPLDFILKQIGENTVEVGLSGR